MGRILDLDCINSNERWYTYIEVDVVFFPIEDII